MTAILTAVAALIAALAAAWQAYLLRKQMRDDARPFVVVDVVPSLHGPGAWDLTLHSTGRSMAHEVGVSTEPATWEPHDDEDHISEHLAAYLGRKRDLPPGARHRLMWRYEQHDQKTGKLLAIAGAPAIATVTVTYEDDEGKGFDSSFSFDLDVLGAVAPVPFGGPRVESDTDQELKNIDRAIRTLSQHVGELRR
ncbi:hypothetical protein [Janibacter sp. LM]|uniref:hypothetical protein n=1 Tax=Janibacter sp. LM TaxID=3144845 RepID=UPI0031F6044B